MKPNAFTLIGYLREKRSAADSDAVGSSGGLRDEKSTTRTFLSRRGFSLVELILYIALAFILAGLSFGFAWNVMGGSVRVDRSTELGFNARFAMEVIGRSVREADTLKDTLSVFGAHPGVLTLEKGGVNLLIDTYTRNVTIGGQSQSIRKLRLQNGAGPALDISTDRVDVQEFIITNLSRPDEPPTLRIRLTLKAALAPSDPSPQQTLTQETALTIRKR